MADQGSATTHRSKFTTAEVLIALMNRKAAFAGQETTEASRDIFVDPDDVRDALLEALPTIAPMKLGYLVIGMMIASDIAEARRDGR